MTLDGAKKLFLDLLQSLESMEANPWPFLCASALVDYLTQMVNGGQSNRQAYQDFVETYLTRVNPRYTSFTYAYDGGKQDLPVQMYHVLRCGIVHSYSLMPDDTGRRRYGGRPRSIVIAHDGSHLSHYTEHGLDAALLVLHDFVIDLGNVIEQIFLAAQTDAGLKAKIEKHLLAHPPIEMLSASGAPVSTYTPPVSGTPF